MLERLFRLRENRTPSLKHSFAVGIGLFLALIGPYQTGLVRAVYYAFGLPH